MTKLFSFRFQVKKNIFQEMDSEIANSRKRIQKWTQKRAAVVVSCSDCCFLFRKRAREAASPGASRHWNRVVFESGRSPFFEAFFEAQKVTNRPPKLPQNGAKIAQNTHFCTTRATSIVAAIYCTLWPLSLPRRPKRCSRTAPKNKHLFKPQKVTP